MELDRDEADAILPALNRYIVAELEQARRFDAFPALRAHHEANARTVERVARRLEEYLFPEPEPPDYDADELVQIRRQTPVVA